MGAVETQSKAEKWSSRNCFEELDTSAELNTNAGKTGQDRTQEELNKFAKENLSPACGYNSFESCTVKDLALLENSSNIKVPALDVAIADVDDELRVSKDASGDAFVAMLHGNDPHWLVCALLLGFDLQRLCPGRQRILLIDKACPWSKGEASQALSCFWSLQREAFKCLPKATKTQRHNRVFNKLRVLNLDVRRALFLDLDILVRSSRIEELFDVPAPAGMLHGAVWLETTLTHGEVISPATFQSKSVASCPWPDFCINAGVLRLDPPISPRERGRICEKLLSKAASIPKSHATWLPEQYFLVQELKGPWRHVGNKYNWEVGPATVIDRWQVYHPVSCEWSNVAVDDVVIFHFSGNDVEPYNYMDLQAAEAEDALQERFRWRDGHLAMARDASLQWECPTTEVSVCHPWSLYIPTVKS
jgi:hypothetical protein